MTTLLNNMVITVGTEKYVPTGRIAYPEPGDYYLSNSCNVILTDKHVSRRYPILRQAE